MLIEIRKMHILTAEPNRAPLFRVYGWGGGSSMAALPSIPNHCKFLFLERKTWTRPMLYVSSLSGSLGHSYRHWVYVTWDQETGTCTKGTRQSSRPNCRRQRHRQQLPFQNPLPSDQKNRFLAKYYSKPFWYDLYKEWSPSDGFRPRRICSQPARILWQVELAKRNSFQCKTFFNQSKGDAGENENLHPCRHPGISSKAVCAQVDCTLQRIMSPFEFGFQAFFVTSVTRT